MPKIQITHTGDLLVNLLKEAQRTYIPEHMMPPGWSSITWNQPGQGWQLGGTPQISLSYLHNNGQSIYDEQYKIVYPAHLTTDILLALNQNHTCMATTLQVPYNVGDLNSDGWIPGASAFSFKTMLGNSENGIPNTDPTGQTFFYEALNTEDFFSFGQTKIFGTDFSFGTGGYDKQNLSLYINFFLSNKPSNILIQHLEDKSLFESAIASYDQQPKITRTLPTADGAGSTFNAVSMEQVVSYLENPASIADSYRFFSDNPYIMDAHSTPL